MDRAEIAMDGWENERLSAGVAGAGRARGPNGRTHGAGLTGQDSRGRTHGAIPTGQDSRGRGKRHLAPSRGGGEGGLGEAYVRTPWYATWFAIA